MSPHRPSRAAGSDGQSESLLTVLIALGANLLIAVAKTFAAVLTGAASMLAEAAHSWADAGNEVFLYIATKRATKPRDVVHPMGYGREAYVWSLFAAFGLFAVGAGVSIMHGVQELIDPEPASLFGVSYAVLAVAFVLEGVSFLRAFKQSRAQARATSRDVLDHVMRTSDPTLRAVFFEDAAALVGLGIAFVGILLHQLTGSAVPDAIGSILVGVLLAVVALVLITQNRRFLIGVTVDPDVRVAALQRLLEEPNITRVTYLHIEYVGPGRVFLLAAVDLAGDDAEHVVAEQLNELEDAIGQSPRVERAVLTLSRPHAAALTLDDSAESLTG